MRRRLAVAAAALAALSVATGAAVGVRAETPAGDPPLSVPQDLLGASLHCPAAFTGTGHEPVLLVHGTFTNDDENWGWNYAKVLPTQGFDTCTVTLPNRALDDIQVASEYVVHAIREISTRSGRKVDVVGHSQGVLEPRWALRWWPSLRDQVDDLVMLAGPNHGTALAIGCLPNCPAAAWQMGPASAFISALDSEDETPGAVSYTSLYSATDELVVPAVPTATAALDGARNILVQDLCPGRVVEHAQFAWDNEVYALVLDALTGEGPADPARFDPSACLAYAFPGVDPTANRDYFREFFGTYPDYNPVPEEPPLAPYARPG